MKGGAQGNITKMDEKVDTSQISMNQESGETRQVECSKKERVWVAVRDRKLQSRVLYPNPVCLLVTHGKDRRNVMVISWLMPVNNKGLIALSMNKKRFSAQNAVETKKISLFVPVSTLEKTLLSIGACSGREVNKFEEIEGLDWEGVTVPQGRKRKATKMDLPVREVLQNTVANLECEITSINAEAEDEHFVILAQITECYIDRQYWNGKQFLPTKESLPPFLKFLGSQRFAYVKHSS